MSIGIRGGYLQAARLAAITLVLLQEVERNRWIAFVLLEVATIKSASCGGCSAEIYEAAGDQWDQAERSFMYSKNSARMGLG